MSGVKYVVMFYRVEDYPFLNKFAENSDIIKNEFENAVRLNKELHDAFKSYILDKHSHYWVKENGLHTEQVGFNLRAGEDYPTALAIYKKDFPITRFNIPELFPELTKMLKTVPNLYYSSFFRMGPRSVIEQHAHARKHLIFHVLITEMENGVCRMSCGDDERVIRHIGDTVLFDYSISHGTINEASNDRINFVIDFNPFTNE